MTTSDLDRPLRQAFRFETADLAANRTGRLSPRQSALLSAGRVGMLLSLAVFVVVMLGTVGLVAFFNWRLQAPGGLAGAVGPAAGALAVIAIGYAVSRRYLSVARARQISVARGLVEVLSEAHDDCRIRIGGTLLRLPDAATLRAFHPGAEYRVYYVAGPVTIVLSGESLPDAVVPPADPARDSDADADEHATANAQLAIVRRGYLIVILLGALALGIPVAGVLAGDLPPRLRWLAWIGLLAIALGFAWLALAWLDPRKRRRP